MTIRDEPDVGAEEAPVPPALGSADREVVDEALEELHSEGGPIDRRPLGCVLTLPAFLALLVVPVLDRRFGLPSVVATSLIVGGVVVLVFGLTIWFTVGGFVRRHVATAAEAALRALETWSPEEGDRTEALRAATLLMLNAHATHGATTSLAFDPTEARRRLGRALPLVKAVERHLVAKGVVHPVFVESAGTGASGGCARGAGTPQDETP